MSQSPHMTVAHICIAFAIGSPYLFTTIAKLSRATAWHPSPRWA
jgi:uncharacterized MAPEG superfamily protein